MRPLLGMAILTVIASFATACDGGSTHAGGGGTPTGPVGPTVTVTRSTSTTSADPSSVGAECVNLTLTDAVRAQLVAADGRTGAALPPGLGSYYGSCGATSYAWTRFIPADDASLRVKVSFQDEGSADELLVEQQGTWRVLLRQQDYTVVSCAAVDALPTDLKRIWSNCTTR